jgi:hypothetical protein
MLSISQISVKNFKRKTIRSSDDASREKSKHETHIVAAYECEYMHEPCCVLRNFCFIAFTCKLFAKEEEKQ